MSNAFAAADGTVALGDIVAEPWQDPAALAGRYRGAQPWPHIVMRDFLRDDLLDRVAREFPDLAVPGADRIDFANAYERKRASAGMAALSPSAFWLVSFLNSDIFLTYLQRLTSLEETLISDPYLAGGGYHEIERGGHLKIHADFNKHPYLDLDRRLNLLIFLNRDWQPDWGGQLLLCGDSADDVQVAIEPHFNTAVLFTTTSHTLHGHPDPLRCPAERRRRSLALYYFSTGRPATELGSEHATLFRARRTDPWSTRLLQAAQALCPPALWPRRRKKAMGTQRRADRPENADPDQ